MKFKLGKVFKKERKIHCSEFRNSREGIVSFIGLDLSVGGNGLEEEGIKGGREREFRPRIRLFVSGRVRGWNGRLSESTLHRQRSEAVYRDRKPICNVLRAGFEILNSKRKEEVDDHPSFGSCSSFSRFLSPRQQLIPPLFFYRAYSNPPPPLSLVKFVRPRYEINFSTLGI